MFHAGLLRDPSALARQAASPAPVHDWPNRFRQLATTCRDARLRRYYEAGVVAAETPLCEVPLLAMDIETTGLNPAVDGIVSIGVLPMRLDTIQASQGRQWLLKPRVPLGDASVALHGITHQQIVDAPDLVEVLDELLQRMAGHVMVMHCRDIERLFMNSALERRLGENIEFPVIDTMELEARLHRHPLLPWWQRWWRRTEPKVSIRLAASRERYGLPRYRLHHAWTDALASAELLQAQVAQRYAANTPVGALWS